MLITGSCKKFIYQPRFRNKGMSYQNLHTHTEHKTHTFPISIVMTSDCIHIVEHCKHDMV